MDFDHVTDKHLHQIERLAGELLNVMRQAKLQDEPVVDALRQLQLEAAEVRRVRFDGANPEYSGY